MLRSPVILLLAFFALGKALNIGEVKFSEIEGVELPVTKVSGFASVFCTDVKKYYYAIPVGEQSATRRFVSPTTLEPGIVPDIFLGRFGAWIGEASAGGSVAVVAGGGYLNNFGEKLLQTTTCGDAWTESAAPIPAVAKIYAATARGPNGTVLVIGGWNSTTTITNEVVEVPATGMTATVVPSVGLPARAGAAAATNVAGVTLLVGGLRLGPGAEQAPTDDVYRSSDGGRSWERVGGAVQAFGKRAHAVLAALPDGRFILYGGEDPATKRIWQTRDDGATWTLQTTELPQAVPYYGRVLTDPSPFKLVHLGGTNALADVTTSPPDATEADGVGFLLGEAAYFTKPLPGLATSCTLGESCDVEWSGSVFDSTCSSVSLLLHAGAKGIWKAVGDDAGVTGKSHSFSLSAAGTVRDVCEQPTGTEFSFVVQCSSNGQLRSPSLNIVVPAGVCPGPVRGGRDLENDCKAERGFIGSCSTRYAEQMVRTLPGPITWPSCPPLHAFNGVRCAPLEVATYFGS